MRRSEGLEPRLPFCDRAYVEEQKVAGYLMDLHHPVGGAKARFFIAHGFAPDEWVVLQRSLVAHGQRNAPTRQVQTRYGVRDTVECNCPTPDGRNHCIRTVWEVGADERPRLLTAIPWPLRATNR